MFVSLAEKQALIERHRGKAWAHILRLEQRRGRKLNRCQIQFVELAIGPDPQAQPAT